MNKITDKSEFIKIIGILSNSDISDEDCIYITTFIVNLGKQLEEKDKIIDEAIDIIKKEFLCYDNESDEYINGNKLLEILERGKNGLDS